MLLPVSITNKTYCWVYNNFIAKYIASLARS